MREYSKSSRLEVFLGKGVLKYAVNVQENTHVEAGDRFWARGNRHQKNLKTMVFQYMLAIFFKDSCTLLHCFNILRNLKKC